jgi:hypothetical protein
MIDDALIRERYETLAPHLDERRRRLIERLTRAFAEERAATSRRRAWRRHRGDDDRRESGDVMTKRTRGNHAPAFKAKVALAALKGEPVRDFC